MISSRRNRETGTRVTVYRPGEELCEKEGWLTVCEDHGLICTHTTRKLAEHHAVVPSGWCEGCRDILKERKEEAERVAIGQLNDELLGVIRGLSDDHLIGLIDLHERRIVSGTLTQVGEMVHGIILEAETAELARRERERAHLEGAIN